jgi:hypothetical protein
MTSIGAIDTRSISLRTLSVYLEQFKVGTDLWNKESKVMLPAPSFGKYLSLNRFKRIARYLAKGPATYNGQAMDYEVNTDAWTQFR